MSLHLTLGKKPNKKLMVVSHERSGTHFLMNTMAENFGFISAPWWNFDFDQPLNFHHPQSIEKYFRQAHDRPALNILKTHHTTGFFEDLIDYLAEQFYILYIYRDPRDVLVSQWKLIKSLDWDEAPKTPTVAEFIRAEPSGAMMRLQKVQEKNMLTRWRTHVEGWVSLSNSRKNNDIKTIKYEDLNLKFDKTVSKIAKFVNADISSPVRPKVNDKVIGKGKGKVATYKKHFKKSDLDFINKELGSTLKDLGYKL